MVLRATPVARALAATPPWPALCASAATCNRRARSSSDGRTASNRSAMGFSSIIPPPYRDHGAARITHPLEAPTDTLISGRRLVKANEGALAVRGDHNRRSLLLQRYLAQGLHRTVADRQHGDAFAGAARNQRKVALAGNRQAR